MKIFSNYSKTIFYISVIILLSIRVFVWHISVIMDYNLISGFSENDMHTFTLKVCSVPKSDDDTVSFDAKIISQSEIINKLHVNLKYAEKLNITYGDRLKISGFLNIADSAMNPGNFDYRNYLKSQGISAIFSSDITRIKNFENGFLKRFYGMRQNLSNIIFKHLPHEEASFINALITGDKSELSEENEKIFKHSGIYHIVAVSGLHLNMFILFLSYFYTILPLRKRKKQAIIILTNFIAISFMIIFTGFGVSVKRAAIMSIILCIAPFLNREYSPVHSLIASMIFILFIEPYSYLDVSFQLSFMATLGIIIASAFIKRYKINERKYSYILESIIISGFSWIFTLPFTVNAFHGVSLITPFSNMLILPMVPILLAFSYVFAIVCIFNITPFCSLAACIVIVPAKAIMFIAEIFSSIPAAYIPLSTNGMLLIVFEFIMLSILVYFCLRSNKKVFISIILLLTIANLSFLLYNNNNRKSEIHFINVGQGECAIIETPYDRNILIDCGSDNLNNVYKDNVMPYMDFEGIYKIDLAFVTHFHNDHINGIIPMLEDNRIKTLIMPERNITDDEKDAYEKLLKAAVKSNTKTLFLSKGDSLDIDFTSKIEILNPFKYTKADSNDASMVIKYICFDKSVLFTGDIRETSQYMLIDENIKTDILKVPHHGAFSKMSDKFSKSLECDYAVISCGLNNQYSHPHEQTLESYSNSAILRTDINKTIRFVIDENSIRHYVYYDD